MDAVFFVDLLGRELLSLCVYADLFLILAHSLETNDAVDQSKEGIILAAAHVGTGMDLGAPLSDEDVAGKHELTVRTLCAQPLSSAISAVSRTTYALFMSEKLQFDKHITLPPLQCTPNSLLEGPKRLREAS